MSRLLLLLAFLMPNKGLAFCFHKLPVGTPFLSSSRCTASTATTTSTVLHAKTALKRLDKNKHGKGRKPSRVQDPYGPTPDVQVTEPELVDPNDVPELADIRDASQLPHPIPHQPWRRGDTAGCEEPIAVVWRKEAEEIIQKAVALVGGRVLDVTWYLTQVVVTIDEEMLPMRDPTKSKGPVIKIFEPTDPRYYDPNDPNPDEIWADEDDVLYQRETEEEAASNEQRKQNMYSTTDADDPEDETHIPDEVDGDKVPLFMNEETRDDMALMVTEEEQERNEELEKPLDLDTMVIDTAALSTVAKAILDALETVEEELQILERHELILTSPGASDVLETQRQFNAYRGFDVIVETVDPFESNRTLKGKLVDRNSMDLVINKKGRMVTVPLNFVKCVRLPAAKREKNVPSDVPF
jgi:ribosome maturation factor RimP